MIKIECMIELIIICILCFAWVIGRSPVGSGFIFDKTGVDVNEIIPPIYTVIGKL